MFKILLFIFHKTFFFVLIVINLFPGWRRGPDHNSLMMLCYLRNDPAHKGWHNLQCQQLRMSPVFLNLDIDTVMST